MVITAVYDANVLFPNTLRDLLVRVAQADLVQVLGPLGIEALRPDEFVLDLIDLDAKIVWACLQQIADSRRHPRELWTMYSFSLKDLG